MYENEVIAVAERAMQRMGAEEFFMLISSGRFGVENNAMTTLHNTASINRRIEKGDSVGLEITPRFNGYWTQIVRTLSVGEPNDELDEFRAVVVGSIAAGAERIKPGVTVGEVVRAMRAYVEDAGYIWSMPCGHIAGVDLNEERLTEDNPRPLAPGMLVILHPTVLKPGMTYGIYWGESYLVAENGCECVMNSSSQLCVTAG